MRPVWDLLKRSRQKDDRAAHQGQNGRTLARVGSLEWVLEAKDAAEYQVRLQHFCAETLEPILDQCVTRRLGFSLRTTRQGPERLQESDAVEIRANTRARILIKLHSMWKLRTQGGVEPAPTIRDFAPYVRKTFNTQRADYIRPDAWRIFRGQVRRVVDQHPLLGYWEVEAGRFLVGRAAWHESGTSPVTLPNPEVFLAAHRSHLDAVRTQSHVEAEVILAILDGAQAPLPFHDVLALLAVYYQVEEPRQSSLPDSDSLAEDAKDFCSESDDSVLSPILSREMIACVWSEIQRMPRGWRQVMILGIDDLLVCILGHRVASLATVAAAVDLSEEELAELYPRIALPTDELARHLGIVPGTVRNHRRDARKALRKLWKEWKDG